MILKGDCIEEMKKLPENSVDAIVTDPPYGLEFMGKDWDKFKEGKNIAGGTVSTGKGSFWKKRPNVPAFYHIDNNKLQQFCLEWATECLRVLKPGGFLLSFGGTRTYHRLVCGIEDAGFEIRDTILWLYGSGFPKSLNIGKQIDKLNGRNQEEFIALGKYLKEKRGDIPQNEISKFFPSKTGGLTGCVSNWELGMNVPTKEQWIILKKELKLDDKFDYLIDRIEAEREVVGIKQNIHSWKAESNFGDNYIPAKKSFEEVRQITAPATKEAIKWEGWGTALKPACEPIVVARKPLSEKNVALNVLKWGTGGINIDACRIGGGERDARENNISWGISRVGEENNIRGNKAIGITTQGRFPANIILDDQAGQMLDDQSGNLSQGHIPKIGSVGNDIYGKRNSILSKEQYLGKGGASRFFYCAKASKSERNYGCEALDDKECADMASNRDFEELRGRKKHIPIAKNNHPTVKPIKLMEYLVKLVSREGAVVLDPFLGSGTTALACQKLNRKWIGIEKEEEYIKIAEARIKPFLEQQKLK